MPTLLCSQMARLVKDTNQKGTGKKHVPQILTPSLVKTLGGHSPLARAHTPTTL